nr:hypothetical protein [Mesorhizobium sp. L2C054A000]
MDSVPMTMAAACRAYERVCRRNGLKEGLEGEKAMSVMAASLAWFEL